MSNFTPAIYPPYQDLLQRQAARDLPAATQVPPFILKQGRLQRFIRRIVSSDHITHDFNNLTTPAPAMTWTEARDKLANQLPPPKDPATDFDFWEIAQLRLGLPLVGQWESSQRFQQQPGAATRPIAIQTPSGVIYLPQSRTSVQQPNAFTGSPADSPWMQWEGRSAGMVFLLAGLQLALKAAASMWQILSMAWDQNLKDQMRMRDQHNEEAEIMERLGIPVSGFQLEQQGALPTRPFGAFPSQQQIPGAWPWR
ncbi:hypothetical protein ABW20_dc0103362 [Dactylellina cionopaga]|nr:hypothetical protein ABW20_dc0103362 [Dactylellina cionopaga]